VIVRGRWRVAGVAVAVAVAAAATLSALSGCDAPQAAEQIKPQIAPPAIKKAGTLRVGVDLSYPPFGGVDQGAQAGIDVEVAKALAGRLGLNAEPVDVRSSEAATALAQGDVDLVLSAPFSADIITRATFAGTYLADGPVLFATGSLAAAATTDSVLSADSIVIGTQERSEAYWLVNAERGTDGVKTYPTLKMAFDALESGEVKAVACDAAVGAYIARDRPDVRYVGMLGPVHLLGVAVSSQNAKLADVVRSTLDKLVSDGAIDAIRRAWLGQLPRLSPPRIEESETSESVLATP
jgi:polar amino acid transport system substrate-binding protein